MKASNRIPASLILSGVAILAVALWWSGQDRLHPAAFDTTTETSSSTAKRTDNRSVAPSSDGATAPAGQVGTTSDLAAAPSSVVRSLAGAAVASSPSVVRPSGPPSRLRIPALGVDAPVDAVLNEGATLRPPDDPSRLGWWIGSSPPGTERGSTVITGHVDSATAGPGALYRLSELPAGSEIVVQAANGGAVGYRVTSRQYFSKADPLPAALFTFGGQPALVLITCGGEFDEDTGSYDENVVVTANPG